MLTKEFAQVLINDYRGFIEEIKDKEVWVALIFLMEKKAHNGLCYYAERIYERDIYEDIAPLIPGLYITGTPSGCESIYFMVERLQARVDWLVYHMGCFKNEVAN